MPNNLKIKPDEINQLEFIERPGFEKDPIELKATVKIKNLCKVRDYLFIFIIV
jgi:hypothetical protein